MRTIEVQLFKFNELSAEAKERAMKDYEPETSCYWNDASSTVEKFNELFGTRSGSHSWLDIDTGSIDTDILNLTGFRLQKYLWNNFKDGLFEGKYYHLSSKTKVNKRGFASSVTRYSKIQFENSFTLTGVCYDMDILDPIYKFLESREVEHWSTTFDSLLEECVNELRKSLESEDDYNNSDEGKSEELVERDNEYLIDGEAAYPTFKAA